MKPEINLEEYRYKSRQYLGLTCLVDVQITVRYFPLYVGETVPQSRWCHQYHYCPQSTHLVFQYPRRKLLPEEHAHINITVTWNFHKSEKVDTGTHTDCPVKHPNIRTRRKMDTDQSSPISTLMYFNIDFIWRVQLYICLLLVHT